MLLEKGYARASFTEAEAEEEEEGSGREEEEVRWRDMVTVTLKRGKGGREIARERGIRSNCRRNPSCTTDFKIPADVVFFLKSLEREREGTANLDWPSGGKRTAGGPKGEL